MEFIGKISSVENPVSGISQNGTQWVRQEFVIEGMQGSYPEKYVMSLAGRDRIANTNLQVGQMVRVQFEGHAKESKGRWYNSLNAFSVQPVTFGATAQSAAVETAANEGAAPGQYMQNNQQGAAPGQYMQNYQQGAAKQQAQAATQMYNQAAQMQGQQQSPQPNNLPFG